MICEGGEVGRAAIWNDEMQNVFFQKAIHRARIKTDYITPEFTVMLFWFLAKYGGLKDYVTTSTISHLTGEKLKTIQIPLPPYKQQVKFSQMINSLNVQRTKLRTPSPRSVAKPLSRRHATCRETELCGRPVHRARSPTVSSSRSTRRRSRSRDGSASASRERRRGLSSFMLRST